MESGTVHPCRTLQLKGLATERQSFDRQACRQVDILGSTALGFIVHHCTPEEPYGEQSPRHMLVNVYHQVWSTWGRLRAQHRCPEASWSSFDARDRGSSSQPNYVLRIGPTFRAGRHLAGGRVVGKLRSHTIGSR
jgi:hypothetical protein